MAVTALFCVLTGVAAAQLLWSLMPAPEAAVWKPAPVPVSTAPATKNADAGAIAATHLFGIYTASAPVASSAVNAPDTRLNLTLMGIFAGTQARESRALIAQQGGSEEPYSIGDDVARGVTLQAIFPDRVILQREGRMETLRLERDKPTAATDAAPYAPLTPDASSAASELAKIRDTVLKDPSKASEYIRVQPANQSGQLRGYRVYPGRDRGMFNTAGLRPGDLITAVNGVELNDAGRALQLLGELSQTTQLNLTLERGGQSQTLNLSLN